MLRRLYELVAQGKPWSTSELALELGVSPELVTLMLEDLARRGLLRAVEGGCDLGCGSCSRAGQCVIGPAHRVWSVNG